ncbi:unnamed protein product [Spirodela intermedia]|uniref:GrpE protein homolog n=1 Tax=Spirodela intermedia TaxID=51605 RepID=A0A7I8KQ47_SPIIN|nr:unnamed protein product [Spirodela intermedia]
MSSRILSRLSRARHGLSHHRVALLSPLRQYHVQCTSYGFGSIGVAAAGPSAKRLGFSSTASPQPNGRESSQVSDEQQTVNQAETNNEAKGSARAPETTDTEEDDLCIDDLVKLVAEKEELLKVKHKEIEKMQDKVLRSYAEMENVIDRTKREAENSKKFSIQNFAKNLLDVADNLGRASSVVKESFSKLETSEDSAGAVSLLKTLLEGVDMTDKQLGEVFKKFGVEKFDPTNEHFDPHRHNAVFQIPDASKEPGTIAVVLKAGYMLYDRVIRPAEVGVIQAADDANEGSDA